MAKTKNLYGASTEKQAMDFEHYQGPMGSDMRQSIRDAQAPSVWPADGQPQDRDQPRYTPPGIAAETTKRGKRLR